MPVMSNIFKDYPNKIFIETGTHLGNGVEKAIEAGFEKIYSIELSDHYFNICKNKFENYSHVEIVKGDSFKMLPTILDKIDLPTTFWLDGHHSCGDTALGEYWAPLMQELEVISKHKIKTHTILIDDMRCWQEPNPVHGFYIKDILEFIPKINSKYKISFIDGIEKNDIMVIKL